MFWGEHIFLDNTRHMSEISLVSLESIGHGYITQDIDFEFKILDVSLDTYLLTVIYSFLGIFVSYCDYIS